MCRGALSKLYSNVMGWLHRPGGTHCQATQHPAAVERIAACKEVGPTQLQAIGVRSHLMVEQKLSSGSARWGSGVVLEMPPAGMT